MQFDLTSGTDAGSHALYDPAAIEPLRARAPQREWWAWITHHEASGRLLHHSTASDGELRLKVLVNEPFDPGLKYARLHAVEGAILRVPSGQLCCSGIEYVHWPGTANRIDDRLVSRCEVPAGTYRVTAFDVAYDVPAEHVERELDAMLEPGDRLYAQRVNNATGCGCGLMLVALVGGAGAFLSGPNWTSRLPVAGIAVGIVVLIGAALAVLHHSARMKRWGAADDAMWRRHPHVVVEMWRLQDHEVPVTFPPARFGPAYVRDGSWDPATRQGT